MGGSRLMRRSTSSWGPWRAGIGRGRVRARVSSGYLTTYPLLLPTTVGEEGGRGRRRRSTTTTWAGWFVWGEAVGVVVVVTVVQQW